MFLAFLALMPLFACQPSRTTRTTVNDLNDMAGAMAASLSADDLLSARGPESPRMVITIDKVQNLSSEVLTESEQWAIIAKLRGSLPLLDLRRRRNVVFVVPPERATDPETRTPPTHRMSATFRSVTRADAASRTDVYYAEFELLDLATGQPEWVDRFEFKRTAKGLLWD